MLFKDKPELRFKVMLIIAAFAFLASGIDSLDKNMAVAMSNFVVAAANLVALYFYKQNLSLINLILFILNAILDFILAFNLFAEGKKALPYAWVIAGVLYLIVSFYTYLKERTNQAASGN